jgi:hypothetical protein
MNRIDRRIANLLDWYIKQMPESLIVTVAVTPVVLLILFIVCLWVYQIT